MAVEPYDEEDLVEDNVVIRRVNPEQHVVDDENTGQKRTSSKLFSPSSGTNGGMSIDVLKLIENDGQDAYEFVTTPIFTGSVCFEVSAARTAGLRVGYDPIIDVHGIPDNPYHGEVWGPNDRPNKFTKGQKRALANASEWFVELPGVAIKS